MMGAFSLSRLPRYCRFADTEYGLEDCGGDDGWNYRDTDFIARNRCFLDTQSHEGKTTHK